MLSRVAESLYWMARYVERAENMTRALAVNYYARLEAQPGGELSWQGVVAVSGDDELYRSTFADWSDASVADFLLWHSDNPNAVASCVARARENARSVREQISSEMWEHLNRLYFYLTQDVDRGSVVRGPYELFQSVRDGSQAFQGITAATMNHGEGYEFIQLGRYLERAAMTVRVLGVRHAEASRLAEGSAASSLHLMALLKSVSAFEAFRKGRASQLLAAAVVEFLLMSSEFPRAVRFCLQRSSDSLKAIASDTARGAARADRVQRALGPLCSELQYLEVESVLGPRLEPYLEQLLLRIHKAGEEIETGYFSTQVVLPGPRGQQAQQQQQ
jgi:uncharacterized alpha-E superfamily protein